MFPSTVEYPAHKSIYLLLLFRSIAKTRQFPETNFRKKLMNFISKKSGFMDSRDLTTQQEYAKTVIATDLIKQRLD